MDRAYIFNQNVKDTFNNNISNNYAITWLTIAIGVMVAMLLLPSLKKFKLGPVELETPVGAVTTAKDVDLKPASIEYRTLSSFNSTMPLKYEAQYFRMALRYEGQVSMPIEMIFTRMPKTPLARIQFDKFL
ncbi:MAG: hypothetical protein WAM14_25550 [Candidatus Nitrosopolaris sp.]